MDPARQPRMQIRLRALVNACYFAAGPERIEYTSLADPIPVLWRANKYKY